MPKPTSRKESKPTEQRPVSDSLLAMTLALAVPLWIEKVRGMPASERQERLKVCGETIAFKGDVMLFGGKPGEAADAFNKLAEGIAHLAFVPGGVTTFGMHFDASSTDA